VKLNALNVTDFTRIEGFVAFSKEIFYFPQGIEDVFKNLITLVIKNCQLKEINAQDLKNFNLLQYIDLSHNEIEILDKKAFNFGVSILTIILNNNRIKFVHQLAFKSISHHYLDLRNNICISDKATDGKVKELINSINIKCSMNSSNVELELRINSNEPSNNHSEINQIKTNSDDSKFNFKYYITYGLIILVLILIITFVVYIILNKKSSFTHQIQFDRPKSSHRENFDSPKSRNVYECQAIYEEIKYESNESEKRCENLENADFYVDLNEDERVEATESYTVVYKST